jgi:integrase
MKLFTAKQVEKIRSKGRHGVGGNLYVSVSPTGTRSWLFVYRHNGKQRELGLGSLKDVSLAEGRAKAAEYLVGLAKGIEPTGKRAAAKATDESAGAPTFGSEADKLIEALRPGWRSPIHARQWTQSLADHAAALRDKPVDKIGTEDVLCVLTPLWAEHRETGDRLRCRIERVLEAAKTRDAEKHPQRWAGWQNPARWKGHLKNLLAARPKVEQPHFKAMSYTQLPAFMGRLRARGGVTARALEFAILCGGRTAEVRDAPWSEINLDEALWTIPGARMKGGETHEVPLSARCVEILLEMREHPVYDAAGFIFPGQRRNKPLSNAMMLQFLKRKMGEKVTVHGMRSTFRDWAGDCTHHSHDVMEKALAHAIKNAAEAAYNRAKALAKRRALMEEWSAYCQSAPVTGNVIKLRA